MTDEKTPEDSNAEEAGQEKVDPEVEDSSESGDAAEEAGPEKVDAAAEDASESGDAAEEAGPEKVDAVAVDAADGGDAAEDAAAEEASDDSAKPEAEDLTSSPDDSGKVVNESDASEDDAEAAMLAMLEDLPQDESGAKPEDINFGSAEVSGAEFQQLSEPSGKGDSRNIEILQDVNLPIAIELGRTKMTIAEILALGPGSVVELNKLAGEPVDVLVNNKAVAKGEVVVIDENFGVRITQLLTPEERLKALGDEQ